MDAYGRDATTAAAVPDPTSDISHSNAAWRNTDSMLIHLGKPWEFVVAVAPALIGPHPDPGPVEIGIAVAIPIWGFVGWLVLSREPALETVGGKDV